jgi:hypothetical protein
MSNAERWIPVRFVPRGARCDFCWSVILPLARGKIGAAAWFSKLLRVHECLSCRSEGFRAELARDLMDRATQRLQ